MKFSEEALKFLSMGMESEIAACLLYRRAASLVTGPSPQELVNELAGDERWHLLTQEEQGRVGLIEAELALV